MSTLVIGSALIEITLKVDKLPTSGSEVVSEDRKVSIGGCAYNVANTLKNLQATYSLFVPIGKGFYANQIKEQLIKDGHEIIIEDQTEDNGFCLSIVESNGQRTFITNRGIEREIKSKWLNKIDLSRYDNVYFDGYKMENESGFNILNKLKEEFVNKNIFFCPGPMFKELKQSILEKIFELNPIIHLNEKELVEFTKEKDLFKAIKILYKLNKNKVIVTLGENGCYYFNGLEIEHLNVKPITNVVDTTGAGDAHIATIIALTGMKISFAQSCQIANTVARKVVNQLGPKVKVNLKDLDLK